MQLYITLEELELLTEVLQDEDRMSRSAAPSSQQATSDAGLRDRLQIGGAFLRRNLSRNLQLGVDEMEDLADSLRWQKKKLTTEICQSEDPKAKLDLKGKLVILEHLLEKVAEACAMV